MKNLVVQNGKLSPENLKTREPKMCFKGGELCQAVCFSFAVQNVELEVDVLIDCVVFREFFSLNF